jgi:arabinoxylan arabinofuranohydrolase
MKNWTDHGIVFDAERDTSWAKKTWAPGAAQRDGKTFLYFGNGGGNIGVVVADNPLGPFKDVKGASLVDHRTPGVQPAQNMWLFDPMTFIDDDGQAYMYFGGNGDNNVRVVKLKPDMITLDGEVMKMTAPNFFEAAAVHKRNGVYYFSYSTTPRAQMRIDYMTSDKPTSGFTYKGIVSSQPPLNNNNHHQALFEFKGQWYHAYHNRYVAFQAGIPTGFRRNIAVDLMRYNADGSIQQVSLTSDAMPQVGYLDPYVRVEGETFNAQNGIDTEPCKEGGMNVRDIQNGDWIRIKGVDFGNGGARNFTASVASAAQGGKIELRVGAPDGPLLGTCEVTGTGGQQTWKTVTCGVNHARGIQDLYLKFTGTAPTNPAGANNLSATPAVPSLFSIDWWQFTKAN